VIRRGEREGAIRPPGMLGVIVGHKIGSTAVAPDQKLLEADQSRWPSRTYETSQTSKRGSGSDRVRDLDDDDLAHGAHFIN
jgi:hypothetical protein